MIYSSGDCNVLFDIHTPDGKLYRLKKAEADALFESKSIEVAFGIGDNRYQVYLRSPYKWRDWPVSRYKNGKNVLIELQDRFGEIRNVCDVKTALKALACKHWEEFDNMEKIISLLHCDLISEKLESGFTYDVYAFTSSSGERHAQKWGTAALLPCGHFCTDRLPSNNIWQGWSHAVKIGPATCGKRTAIEDAKD